MIKIAHPIIGSGGEQAVLGLLQSEVIIQGEKFEKKFSKHCNIRYAIATKEKFILGRFIESIKENKEVHVARKGGFQNE